MTGARIMALTDVGLENYVVVGKWAETLLVIVIKVVPEGFAHKVLSWEVSVFIAHAWKIMKRLRGTHQTV